MGIFFRFFPYLVGLWAAHVFTEHHRVDGGADDDDDDDDCTFSPPIHVMVYIYILVPSPLILFSHLHVSIPPRLASVFSCHSCAIEPSRGVLFYLPARVFFFRVSVCRSAYLRITPLGGGKGFLFCFFCFFFNCLFHIHTWRRLYDRLPTYLSIYLCLCVCASVSVCLSCPDSCHIYCKFDCAAHMRARRWRRKSARCDFSVPFPPPLASLSDVRSCCRGLRECISPLKDTRSSCSSARQRSSARKMDKSSGVAALPVAGTGKGKARERS